MPRPTTTASACGYGSGGGGGHFEVSSALSSTPTSPISGLCTPCHDPHGVSTTLEQAYSVPLLKGTWLTSPYEDDKPPLIKRAGTERTDMEREGVKYNIDQNTFGSGITDSTLPGIQETDSKFAGLCLNCHQKSSLTNGTNHTWKSKDRIHESVKGWKTADATIEHNYPCSKCHAPHNSRLPRLMITNCLETKHKGFQTNNTAPRLAGTGGPGSGGTCYINYACCGTQSCASWTGSGPINCSQELGYCSPGLCCGGNGGRAYLGVGGGGRMVGNVNAGCIWGSQDHSVTCHENHDSNQYWNVKTPWTVNTLATPTLIHEPNIIGAVPQSVTLEWNSVAGPNGDPVQYYVQLDHAPYFDSPDYTSGWISGTSWTVSISTNGTWYWRVQARDANQTDLLSVWSFSDSFSIRQAPPAPTIISGAQVNQCPSTYNEHATVQWNPVTDPDGDPVVYCVQYSSQSNFGGVSDCQSGGISGTIWTTPCLAPGYTWYWRVQAVDANYPFAVSPWSTVGSFHT